MLHSPNKRLRGLALIVSVATLMVLSVVGIMFVRQAMLWNAAAINARLACEGEFVAQAGVEAAVAQIASKAKQGRYVFVDFLPGNLGLPVDQQNPPSYHRGTRTLLRGGRYKNQSISGQIFNHPYVLKVNDVAGKIDLNAQLTILKPALYHLCAILRLSPGIAQKILSDRDRGKFSVLEAVPQRCSLDAKTWRQLLPFVTVFSPAHEVLAPDGRLLTMPLININVAMPEVIQAVLTSISGRHQGSGQEVSISADEARQIAMAVMQKRPFVSWREFLVFVAALELSEEQKSLLMAHCYPRLLPGLRDNPEQFWRPFSVITRCDLVGWSFAFSLAASGVFEIESWGLSMQRNEIVSEHKITAVVKVFSEQVCFTQAQFEQSRTHAFASDPAMPPAITAPVSVTRERKPSDYAGWISKSIGNGGEQSLHASDMLASRKLSDGALINGFGPIPLAANSYPTETPKFIEFCFKPGDNWKARNLDICSSSEPICIFRALSPMAAGSAVLVVTEIWYLPQTRQISASRSLAIRQCYADAPGQTFPKIYYEGALQPDVWEKLLARGVQLYEHQLGAGGSSVSTGDPTTFAYCFAREMLLRVHNGDNTTFKVPLSFTTVTGHQKNDKKRWWWEISTSEVNKTIELQVADYLADMFVSCSTRTINRSADVGYLRTAAVTLTPPIQHPYDRARHEFRIDQVSFDAGAWYSLLLTYRGLLISDVALVSAGGVCKGREHTDGAESPFPLFLMDDQVQMSALLACGTYLMPDFAEPAMLRFRPSLWEASQPFHSKAFATELTHIANVQVTAFEPGNDVPTVFLAVRAGNNAWLGPVPLTGGLPAVIVRQPAPEAIDYQILLSGNPFQTPVVSEIRWRLCSKPQILYVNSHAME